MKIKLSQKVKQMASALLVVMVLGGILCLFVMYYLSLVQQQNTLSVRSQAWNLAIAVTEAGIEEGLQAINSSSGNLNSTEWTFDGTYYCRSNTMPDGNSYGLDQRAHHASSRRSPPAPTSICRRWRQPRP